MAMEHIDLLVREDADTHDIWLTATSTKAVTFLGEINEGTLADMTRIIAATACEQVFLMADDIGLFMVTLG